MRITPAFEVVAHRGARTLADPEEMAPENTMPAFQAAARLGAAIELDVIATRDGRLVVHHDDATGKIFQLPGGDKPVRLASFEEMRQARLNISGHERDVWTMMGNTTYRTPERFRRVTVPELDDVLESLPNTRFYVELKTYDKEVRHGLNNNLEARVARLIREKNLYDRVTVISFSPLSLRTIKTLDPRIRTGLDIEMPAWLPKQPLALWLLLQGVRRWVKADSFHPPFNQTTPALVRMAHRLGMPVVPWVYHETRAQEVAMFTPLMAMGVDGLMTNAPDLLMQAAPKP